MPIRFSHLAAALCAACLSVPASAAGVKAMRPKSPVAKPMPVEKVELAVPEMKTPEKAALVTVALCSLPGVKGAVTDINTRLVVVDYQPKLTAVPRFVAACQEAGLEASEYRVEDRFPKPIKLKGG